MSTFCTLRITGVGVVWIMLNGVSIWVLSEFDGDNGIGCGIIAFSQGSGIATSFLMIIASYHFCKSSIRFSEDLTYLRSFIEHINNHGISMILTMLITAGISVTVVLNILGFIPSKGDNGCSFNGNAGFTTIYNFVSFICGGIMCYMTIKYIKAKNMVNFL